MSTSNAPEIAVSADTNYGAVIGVNSGTVNNYTGGGKDLNYQCLEHLYITDPRLDKSRIQDTKGGLLADAYRWVLDNQEFQKWRDESEIRLLWINGEPGKGKTMLLCGIIDELQGANTTDGSSRNFTYFFCEAADPRINNATAVVRSLIYLLISQQPTLISHVREKYDPAGRTLFEDTNAWAALLEILTSILQDPALKTTYLVIDALDECVTDQLQLLQLIVQKSPVSSHVKWIVASRDWPEIKEQLAMVTDKAILSLDLNAESVTSAVNAYIRNKVDDLAKLKNYDAAMKDAVQDYLSSNANDTFLWVGLACRALGEPKVRKRHTLEKLRTFPRGLDALYARMMEYIVDSEDADICKHILAVVTIARRPISLDELTSLVDVPNDCFDDPGSLQEVIGLCGSFLTIRERIVYLIHKSAKDYLSSEAGAAIFPSGQGETHYGIFSRSMELMSRTLRRNMYDLDHPGFPIDQVEPPKPTEDPLAAARYSCIYWVDHLDMYSQHQRDLRCNGTVDEFLREKYLYWLEALSLTGHMSEGVLAMGKLESLLGQVERSELTHLVRDARRFVLANKQAIEIAPLQAYTSALVFSPDNSLVRVLFNKEEPGWMKLKPRMEANWTACLQTLEGHKSSVNSVVFSADGKQLASGSDDMTIRIWDAGSGACLKTLKGHEGWVNSVVFSADSKLLASGSGDNTIRIWDASSGTCLQMLEGHDDWVNSVVFSADSKLLASGSRDKTIRIWDASLGTYLRTLDSHESSVNSVVFSVDSKQLASGSVDRTIRIWDASSGEFLQMLEGHDDWVRSVVFSADGKQLASSSCDETIRIWDVSSGICLQMLQSHRGWVNSVIFSTDGKYLISGSGDETIRIWDAGSGACLQMLKGHDGSVNSVVFSADGKHLVSGSEDETINIWDASLGIYLHILAVYDSSVDSVVFLANSKQLTSSLEDHNSLVNSIVFSADGKQLISGSDDNTIRIWDVGSGTCLQTLDGHESSVNSVVFSADGKQLASGSDDETIRIWDAGSGTCLQTLEGHENLVNSVVFSADSKLLASSSGDETIGIWDVSSGTCLQMLEGHDDWVNSVVFSGDSQQLASGSRDKTIRIWGAGSGACLQTLKGHDDWVNSVVFSEDGKHLASDSADRTIRIWNASSGVCLQTLKGYNAILPPNSQLRLKLQLQTKAKNQGLMATA